MLATRMMRAPFLTDFRLMDDFFTRAFGNGQTVTGWVPPLDVRETEDEYVVLVDLPGVKQEDVSVELVDNVLTISGTRVPAAGEQAWRNERPYGSFTRSLTLPQGIESDAIAATYTDGVLTLHVPKPAQHKPRRIEIGSGNGQRAIAQ